eukprot:TRINITY_DN18832_c0_g1_i1.p1 TRINITY_DN18832_c0_g1~~TRINITY_DN18832_c0_g1_i1.p1  ORF type:complete len:690 (-),score=104.54 TRINITY_DN18832_c0_g1_i1:913-2940(-)
MADWVPPLDTRQGGLQSSVSSGSRRWDAGGSRGADAQGGQRSNGRVARRAESDLVASNSGAVSGYPNTEPPATRTWEPPPPSTASHRWAGPGASWPQPPPGSEPDVRQTTAPTSPASAKHDGGDLESAATPSAAAGGAGGLRPRVYVVWHKHSDLRLHDHEPLSRAHLQRPRLPVIHMHVFDAFWFGRTRLGKFRKTGALRARFWLECVADLRASLRGRGQELFLRHGMSAGRAVLELSKEVEIAKIFTYAEVCSEELEREQEVEKALSQIGGRASDLSRCWGYTLHHIDDLKDMAKPPEKWITPYLSFGTFKKEIATCKIRPVGYEWRDLAGKDGVVALAPPPQLTSGFWGALPLLQQLGYSTMEAASVEALDPRSQYPWYGGENPALVRLEEYIWQRRALKQYVGTTDWTSVGKCTASRDQTSKLSPYLAFGCLSPRLLYWEIQRFEKVTHCKGTRGLVNSLLWRDFYRFIVYYAWGDRMFHLYGPTSCGSVPGGHKIPTKWCCKHYNNIFGGSDPRLWEWPKDRGKLQHWIDGTTGYPFVDAAMRELKTTGYLHHLNRETVGWFFVRDVRVDWRLAAEWFESVLVDYDCVLNWGNWVYFILTQLPAREDDRPGGGPRYTLPRYSPYLMASQVSTIRQQGMSNVGWKRCAACPPSWPENLGKSQTRTTRTTRR